MRLRLLLAILAATLLSACGFGPQAPPTPTLAPGAESLLEGEPSTPTADSAEPAATAEPDAPRPTPEPQPTEAARVVPRFESAPCEFGEPAGVVVECGYLTVLEDRALPDGPTIELHVATFRSLAASPAPDPIVYLDGGPGADALERLPLVFDLWFRPFLDSHDLIVFDQRGTGFSRPSLACPELVRLRFETLDDDLDVAASNRLWQQQADACRSRLAGEGINLAAYNSLASAADLAELRVALGYEEWNLFGSSYGTRLALTTMREYPEGIRSVILDSTRPLQADEASTPVDAEAAFQQLFQGCAASSACNSAYPDLEEVFYRLVERLDAEPVTVPGFDPFTGRQYQVLLNGESMIITLFQALYSTDVIPELPRAIYAAAERNDFDTWVRLIMNNVGQSDYFSDGVYYSVRCHDEVAFETREQLAAGDDALPQQREVFDMSALYDTCATWGAGTAPPVENLPVSSDIPTLLLAGQYDPATRPEDARAAATTLANSFVFEFPGAGHGPIFDGGCALDIARAFLDDPASRPDDSCIAAMAGPPFVVGTPQVTLMPLRDERLGIESVVPDGWAEVQPGIHAGPNGDVAILQAALPIPASLALANLEQQFELDGPPEVAGERASDRFSWQLYRMTVRGQPADLALAEADGQTFLVLLISSATDRDAFYEQVFLPALDALTPIAAQ